MIKFKIILFSVIKFNQKAWLKPYSYINTKLRKKSKMNFEKDFFKMMKLVTTERRRNYLVSEPMYHGKFISNRNKKSQILMSKPAYLALSTLDLSKTVMY